MASTLVHYMYRSRFKGKKFIILNKRVQPKAPGAALVGRNRKKGVSGSSPSPADFTIVPLNKCNAKSCKKLKSNSSVNIGIAYWFIFQEKVKIEHYRCWFKEQ